MESLPLADAADPELRFDWVALASKAQPAEVAAAQQAQALTRALAAHGIVTQRDAAPEEPLKRAGLLAALVEHGVDGHSARAVLADWAEVSADFRGDPEGLSASVVAGLAERTLTRSERRAALDQVAVSPRCLNRLAATMGLLAAVRGLLPLVPPEGLGRDVLVAVVALALGRADRVIDLYAARARTLAMKTLVEVAAAQLALSRGAAATFEADPLAPTPPTEDRRRAPAPRADTEVMDAEPAEAVFDEDGEDEDEDDVLDIVEERVDSAVAAVPMAAAEGPPRPARWGTPPEDALEPDALARFEAELRQARTEAARLGSLLGVSPLPVAATVRPRPVPPDERLLTALRKRDEVRPSDEDLTERISIDPLLHGHGLEVVGLPFDPLFPPVRGAVRAASAAAEGQAPSLDAVAEAGDLGWALSRARALALVVQGDLTQAQAAAAGLGEGAAPEGRWAADRWLRFGGRAAEPVDPREARAVAAGLVGDIFLQLARTLAGTVPTHG